jgi:hypothetical protein
LAGTNVADADVGGDEFVMEGVGEGLDSGFCGTVYCAAGVGNTVERCKGGSRNFSIEDRVNRTEESNWL